MAILQFDVDDFRAQFPGLFPDPPNTDALIEIFWSAAVCYVSPDTAGPISADCRREILNFVTAHLITLSDSAQAGNQAGFVVSASIDKISVTIQAPPSKTAFQFFLNQTHFGIQAYALLYAGGVGGSYFGGFNELGSFRRAGGAFTPPSRVVSEDASDLVCILLTRPPAAPYDFTIGPLAEFEKITQPISVLPGCESVTFAIETDSASSKYDINFWTGIDLDSGNRLNVYYWGSDTRVANDPPGTATNQNPTGENEGEGFGLIGVSSGSVANTPNLLAVTGFNNETEQILNVSIERVAD